MTVTRTRHYELGHGGFTLTEFRKAELFALRDDVEVEFDRTPDKVGGVRIR